MNAYSVSEISLFTCNTTDCDKSDTELCPPDSELVFSAAADVASYCHCNLSRCAVPGCATGFTPILVQQGTGVPGNCCDEHICIRLSGDLPFHLNAPMLHIDTRTDPPAMIVLFSNVKFQII